MSTATLMALAIASAVPGTSGPSNTQQTLAPSYDVPRPPPVSAPVLPPSPAEESTRAYSRTVTAQFRAFARVERRQRRISGALRIGAGVLLLGVGATNLAVKRGTSAQGSGLGIFTTGAVSVAGGAYSLAVRGPAESFTRTPLFNHGAVEGWNPQMLQSVIRQTERQAVRARKRRRVVGSLLVAGGAAGGAAVSTLLGLELAKASPNGALTSSYAQGIATSVSVVVAGITQLAVPTIIEVLAKDLRRR